MGPVISIFYTNNIRANVARNSAETKVVTYVDDTQTLDQCPRKDLLRVLQEVKKNLDRAGYCYTELQLTMNAAKARILLCGATRMLSRVREAAVLEIAAQTVQVGTAVENLAIHLYGHRTFGTHVSDMSQQVCSILTYLSCVRRSLTEKTIKLLVQTLILRRLDYCYVV